MEPLAAGDPWQVGPYRLRARLGAGGMGQVYLGYSPAGRAVAVKVTGRRASAKTGTKHPATHQTQPPAAAASGHKIWAFTVGNSIWSSVVVADGVVYFGSTDNNLYAVRA